MEAFTFEAGLLTSAFCARCALRMRVSMSAMGSVILIIHAYLLVPVIVRADVWRLRLPARLDKTRHITAHSRLAQLVASETELAIHTVGAAAHAAAAALAGRARVARQRLELAAQRLARVRRLIRFAELLFELGALGGIFLRSACPLDFALYHRQFGHNLVLNPKKKNKTQPTKRNQQQQTTPRKRW